MTEQASPAHAPSPGWRTGRPRGVLPGLLPAQHVLHALLLQLGRLAHLRARGSPCFTSRAVHSPVPVHWARSSPASQKAAPNRRSQDGRAQCIAQWQANSTPANRRQRHTAAARTGRRRAAARLAVDVVQVGAALACVVERAAGRDVHCVGIEGTERNSAAQGCVQTCSSGTTAHV